MISHIPYTMSQLDIMYEKFKRMKFNENYNILTYLYTNIWTKDSYTNGSNTKLPFKSLRDCIFNIKK